MGHIKKGRALIARRMTAIRPKDMRLYRSPFVKALDIFTALIFGLSQGLN
jgi:hypothetical protein